MVTYPDLVLSDVNIPEEVTWGESAVVTWTVTNKGSGTAGADWYDGIYLSSDEILDSSDVYLANRRVGSESPLAPGDSYTASRTVNIPAGSHIGKPYILVKTDYSGNYEKESNESNNVRAAEKPDLDTVRI